MDREKAIEIIDNYNGYKEAVSKPILHLNLKGKWFDMIASGEKKEEYREYKPYWETRLIDFTTKELRQFDLIRFRNGYAKTSPTMEIEYKGLYIGQGHEKWGFEGNEDCFIIKIGKIVSISNYTK